MRVTSTRRRRRVPVSNRDRSTNRLLRTLSTRDYAALLPNLERVTLATGQIISQPRHQARHLYFPETAVLSLVVVMADGAAVEAATVGNEGVAGLSAFLGRGAMSTRCLSQIAGDAQRIAAPALLRVVAASTTMAAILRRYTQAFVNQLAQSVACNRLHSIDQRCARWLLMTHDRVGRSANFDLTQEFLSYMLGVRREGVSVASHALQERGIIRYRRGHMSVLDRRGLERAACECYGATRADYERVFA